MASAVPFDRETLLDLVVNAIPLGIMLFFIGVFVLVNPFGSDPVATAIQLTIVGVTFVALFVLTYVSGKAISESEKRLEETGHLAVSDPAGTARPGRSGALTDPRIHVLRPNFAPSIHSFHL